MPPHLPCWSSRLLVEAEVSTMRKRMSVADIESSSTGEVAVLEELEDVIFQDYGKEQWSFGFWGNDMHRLLDKVLY
ncbi:uncharacterized protein LOC125536375 isoform X3 [Triticum urartu]|uniref:uncharacterized protein LOC125536375 isoform X3 n=1 Tax=Triticum urartu TaxID=4572 RepID=UPI002043F065|nr:uncharacterized protein LOC125536375 isoform X3 [Triticum urartu]